MPINPAIAMGVQPLQLADPLAQYGKIAAIQQAQNQNALAQYQLGAAQRAEAKDIARTNALAQAGTDDTAIANALLKAGDLKGYSEFLKTRRETMKTETELVDARLKLSRAFLDNIHPGDPNAPAQFIAWHEANHRDPVLGPMLAARGVTAEQSRARIQDAIARGPEAFALLLAGSKLGTERTMELNKPTLTTQDLSGQVRVISTPGLGGAATIVPGSVATKTLTPGEALPKRTKTDLGGAIITEEYDPVTRSSRIVDRQLKSLTPEQTRAASQESTKVAHTLIDAAGNVTLLNMFGQIIQPRAAAAPGAAPAAAPAAAAVPAAATAAGAPVTLKGKPSATFEKTQAQRVQLSKDLTTAITQLEDAIKPGGLLDQATGSGIGSIVDIAARQVGKATKGDIATSQLKPIADLALKMVPRFEGPQSDKDRQAYESASGQLADSTLPRESRRAAAKTVLRLMKARKDQFVSTDMAAEGTTAGGGVDTNNPLLK